MTTTIRFLMVFVLAASVLLPGLQVLADTCHSHGACLTSASNAVEIRAAPSDHEGPWGCTATGHAHCDGPFHQAHCGHVLSYFREIPVFNVVEAGALVFAEFHPQPWPSPFLERPIQPPRA